MAVHKGVIVSNYICTYLQAKEHQMVRRFPPEMDERSGLFTSKIGLQFWIRESHLDEDGKVK